MPASTAAGGVAWVIATGASSLVLSAAVVVVSFRAGEDATLAAQDPGLGDAGACTC